MTDDADAGTDVEAPADDTGVADGATDLAELRTVADYQFGAGAGQALFPRGAPIDVRRTASGRPRQVLSDGDRLVTYTSTGRFTVGIAGGRRLLAAFDPPTLRVVVGDDSEPFVRDGKNAFAKFVTDVDPQIRAGDEALVTHEDGHLLAVGRAELSARGIEDFDTGMAVKVRHGVED